MAALDIRIDRLAFQAAIQRTQGVIDKKGGSNVLSHVLISAVGTDRVQIFSTDYDVTVLSELEAEVLTPGSACINGKSLFDVVKGLDEPQVRIEAQPNHWAVISAGRAVFRLAGIAAQDYPEIKLPSDVSWLAMPGAVVRDLIEKTSFSMSNDETRMNLNGVFLKLSAGSAEGLARVMMVSTDGHRLSKLELEAEVTGFGGEPVSAIVHKKGVSEVKRLTDGDTAAVEIGFAKGLTLFRSVGQGGRSNTTLTVRQIDDNYPDFARVIPSAPPVQVIVPRERLARAVRRNATLTSSKTAIVKVELQQDRLAITASNPDYGEGRDEVDVAYDGPGMVIGYNYNYILDVLGAIRGESAVFQLTDEFSPTMITSPTEPGAVFVVMPMRV
jgi:DNA polymerase-3 subunit beta